MKYHETTDEELQAAQDSLKGWATPDPTYIVLVDYQAVLETKDKQWAHHFYRAECFEHKETESVVRLAEIVSRSDE